jgi:hypothetical protein
MDNNNDNLSNILESELSNIFDNIMNYVYSQDDSPRNNQESANDTTILHTLQLNTLNNLINQYCSQINIFQENMRDLIQTLRTTIYQQNIVYSHRRNNIRQNTQTPPPVFSRTNARNTSRAWNIPHYDFTNIAYEIPQLSTPRRPLSNRIRQQQINNAIQIVEYNEEMSEERCPITLENFIVGENVCKIIHCGHIFKSAGLMQWFQRNIKCPVCRYDIRTYQPSSNSQLPDRESASEYSEMLDSSRNIVNTRNIIHNRINSIMRQLQNHLPENDVPTLFTIDIPIYIEDMSYNIPNQI